MPVHYFLSLQELVSDFLLECILYITHYSFFASENIIHSLPYIIFFCSEEPNCFMKILTERKIFCTSEVEVFKDLMGSGYISRRHDVMVYIPHPFFYTVMSDTGEAGFWSSVAPRIFFL